MKVHCDPMKECQSNIENRREKSILVNSLLYSAEARSGVVPDHDSPIGLALQAATGSGVTEKQLAKMKVGDTSLSADWWTSKICIRT